ncbi:uracil-DNA glycosylase [Candidatus Uhrbacteria bacterium]|nr:uracil-DNA glycosylase [Candidatus Uhrbacteria bacterium]
MSIMKDTMDIIGRELVEMTHSPLYEDRVANNSLPVIGAGDLDADVLFIGEAPGKKEAETGVPFCGASGKILDRLLADIGLDRATVYITNVVKDRPPKNRDPRPEEIELYAPFLDRQIDIIKPNVIATLGRFSMEYVMRRYGLEDHIGTITETRGNIFTTSINDQEVTILPLYHPAVAVYNRTRYDELLSDFEKLKDYVETT